MGRNKYFIHVHVANTRGRFKVVGGGVDHSNQLRGVEKLCEGPTVCATRHEKDTCR